MKLSHAVDAWGRTNQLQSDTNEVNPSERITQTRNRWNDNAVCVGDCSNSCSCVCAAASGSEGDPFRFQDFWGVRPLSFCLFLPRHKTLLECRVANAAWSSAVGINRARKEDADATDEVRSVIQRNTPRQRRNPTRLSVDHAARNKAVALRRINFLSCNVGRVEATGQKNIVAADHCVRWICDNFRIRCFVNRVQASMHDAVAIRVFDPEQIDLRSKGNCRREVSADSNRCDKPWTTHCRIERVRIRLHFALRDRGLADVTHGSRGQRSSGAINRVAVCEEGGGACFRNGTVDGVDQRLFFNGPDVDRVVTVPAVRDCVDTVQHRLLNTHTQNVSAAIDHSNDGIFAAIFVPGDSRRTIQESFDLCRRQLSEREQFPWLKNFSLTVRAT